MCDHRALVYSSADEFLAATVPFVREGLRAGDRVLAVSTPENVDALAGALAPHGGLIDRPDSREWYAAPGKTLLAYKRYVDEHGDGGRRVTIVGEPVWSDRAPAAVREWARYESVINMAFADTATRILCPYDARVLPEPILDHAERSHPTLASAFGDRPSPHYLEPAAFCARLDSEPLEAPDAAVSALVVTPDLTRVRRFVERSAARSGLDGGRITDLALAVHELAANGLRHGGTPVALRIWSTPGEVVAEVADSGRGLRDPLAGLLEPEPTARGGRGLWMARQLCDLVEVRSAGSGAVVRVHISG